MNFPEIDAILKSYPGYVAKPTVEALKDFCADVQQVNDRLTAEVYALRDADSSAHLTQLRAFMDWQEVAQAKADAEDVSAGLRRDLAAARILLTSTEAGTASVRELCAFFKAWFDEERQARQKLTEENQRLRQRPAFPSRGGLRA